MKHVYLVIFDLNIEKGGKTTSLLTRAKTFNDYGIKTDIITFDYKSNYQSIINNLRSIGKLDDKTQVYNQFSFFEKRSLHTLNSNKNINNYYSNIIDNNIPIEIKKNKYEIFSSTSGEKIAVLKYKNNNEDYILDIFDNNNRVKRIYSFTGWIRRIKEFSTNGTFKAETFFNRNGQPFLRRNINPSTQGIEDIYLFSENQHFNNNKHTKISYEEIYDDRFFHSYFL
ncbi:glycosyltransferase [Staphylococcus epidermidis]|uniref:glycosyltransferase n=1 Tax=Staphylococcus epidermidis TaxID=1282 RepID=UPI00287F57A5|nr:glycosyltransferase [Staphylococcus epidermidis]